MSYALEQCNDATNKLLEDVSILAEWSDELNSNDLADVGAACKRAADALEKAHKAIKARILCEANDNELRGNSFTARIVESIRWTLDTKAIKEEMGEDWTTAHSKCANVRSVRYVV